MKTHYILKKIGAKRNSYFTLEEAGKNLRMGTGSDLAELAIREVPFQNDYSHASEISDVLYDRVKKGFFELADPQTLAPYETIYYAYSPEKLALQTIAFNAAGNLIATATINRKTRETHIHLIDLQDGSVNVLETIMPRALLDVPVISHLSFAPDGQTLCYAYDAPVGRELKTIDVFTKASQLLARTGTGEVGHHACGIEFNTANVVVFADTGQVKVIDFGTQKPLLAVPAEIRPGWYCSSFALADDATDVVIAYTRRNSLNENELHWFDYATQKLIKVIPVKGGFDFFFRFLTGTKKLLMAHDNRLEMFDLESEGYVAEFLNFADEPMTCFDMAFHPGKNLLAVGTYPCQLDLHEALSLTPFKYISFKGRVYRTIFSVDGSRLALMTYSGEIAVIKI
jgi:hypothetical protein